MFVSYLVFVSSGVSIGLVGGYGKVSVLFFGGGVLSGCYNVIFMLELISLKIVDGKTEDGDNGGNGDGMFIIVMNSESKSN